jgi:hypothetical protein
MRILKSDNGGEYVEMPLKVTYHIMSSLGKNQYFTHLNKMSLFKGKIKSWLKWHDVFFRPKAFQLGFGKKLSTTQ